MLLMQGGRRDALGELYDRYCDRAFRVARAVATDDADAAEAVQDGFVSVWRSRATYRPEGSTAAAWLLTVVRRRALDITSRKATGQAPRGLKASLARLTDPQREVIELAIYGQLTQAEIADELGLPVDTVKSSMRLGLHQLRGAIDPELR